MPANAARIFERFFDWVIALSDFKGGLHRLASLCARPCLFVQLNSEVVPVELSREPVALQQRQERNILALLRGANYIRGAALAFWAAEGAQASQFFS